MKTLLLLLCLFLIGGGQLRSEALPVGRTVVLANKDQPDSLALARYYMEKRGIPSSNLYLLSAPERETISWREFIETLYNPLQANLIEDGWIDALVGASTETLDDEGRRRERIRGHRIAYLVICRGIPLRIEHDPHRLAGRNFQQLPQPLRTNRSSVDSELSLLAQSGYEITAFLQNPLFRKETPSFLEQNQVVRVSRLDGPTLADAKALVDGALLGESAGVRGRAYIDLGGVSEKGDEWLRTTAATVQRLGFDVSIDETSGQFNSFSRFDAPALYFGWYASHLEGPFLRPGFRFPPGAIALHIHSFSAQSVRSRSRHWVGPLVARGVSGTLGNVFEPYLEFSHRPDLFLEALAAGKTFGEAAYFALPVLSWQSVSIGDPLYRPFLLPLDAQVESGDNESDAFLASYAILRRMNLLKDQGNVNEALKLGREALSRGASNWVLALPVARLHARNRERREALAQLNFAQSHSTLSTSEIPVVMEIADFLTAQRAGDLALSLYENLLAQEGLSHDLRQELLKRGIEKAAAARRTTFAARWRRELQELDGR